MKQCGHLVMWAHCRCPADPASCGSQAAEARGGLRRRRESSRPTCQIMRVVMSAHELHHLILVIILQYKSLHLHLTGEKSESRERKEFPPNHTTLNGRAWFSHQSDPGLHNLSICHSIFHQEGFPTTSLHITVPKKLHKRDWLFLVLGKESLGEIEDIHSFIQF